MYFVLSDGAINSMIDTKLSDKREIQKQDACQLLVNTVNDVDENQHG